MTTVFTKIMRGEFPGTFVWRDDQCCAFMSINPLAPGHVLVAPIEEVDHWVDTSAELAAHLFAVAHVIGRAQQAAFRCERVGVIVAGYEVPHTHIHVVPTSSMSELNFSNAAASVGRDEMESWADAIRSELVRLRAAGVST
jgi:histidine triad (HIT) family protein